MLWFHTFFRFRSANHLGVLAGHDRRPLLPDRVNRGEVFCMSRTIPAGSNYMINRESIAEILHGVIAIGEAEAVCIVVPIPPTRTELDRRATRPVLDLRGSGGKRVDGDSPGTISVYGIESDRGVLGIRELHAAAAIVR